MTEPPQEPGEPKVVVPPRPKREHDARDAAGAPVPGDESGRTDRVDPGDSAFRMIGRGLLFVPKIAFEVVMTPVRSSVWAYQRYQLEDRYYRWFFNDDRTIGFYPTASYATGFGIVAGMRFVDRDLFGEREEIAVEAAAGGIYHLNTALILRSGDRFGPGLHLGFDGNFDRRDADPFYGIGNSDVTTAPAMLIDPLTDSTAVETHHRYQEGRVAAFADVNLVGPLRVIGHGALTNIKLSDSTSGHPPTSSVYDPAHLVGFMGSVTHVYGELELRYDTRDHADRWEPHDIHSIGTLAAAFVGGVDGVSGAGNFAHYGVELQHFLRITTGPRVFALRFHGEGVTGALDEIPLTELPYLGGDAFLRGYTFERFRDRVAAVATAQYQWDVARNINALLFTDAGRVYSSLDALTLSNLRVGFGFGVEIHDNNGHFMFESSIASSIDGGVVLSLSFNPVLDARARWR